MAGGVAVTVAGRPRRAGFRQAPIGGKTLADLARQYDRNGDGGSIAMPATYLETVLTLG